MSEVSKRFSSVEEYVKQKNGKRVIKKILISNNGLSALKGIRSMKDWSYYAFGKVLLKFVVMATPEDLKANLEYIHEGDEVLQVPGGSNENNYANIKLIVDLAKESNCDAVWPGWGHASEFPELPMELAKAGIIFIGPDSRSMSILGDKINASIVAEKAGVPTIPWSGSGLKNQLGPDCVVSDEVYKSACVHSVEQALKLACKIGYPVMLKATSGGGGKGIRCARNEDEMVANFDQVRKEVQGSPIFIMKLAENNRHLEVQLVADQFNNAIAIHTRDCTVQRRHQKIIEEGPVTVATENELREMMAAAVRLSKLVNYQNAGTVEYLYSPGEGFFFLELNPRLQVEHPVTEGITGLNLPSIQLQVAMGIPLYCIPGVRKYFGKEDFHSVSQIDFEKETPLAPKGHTLACRITAENPENGFLGTSGSIDELVFQTSLNVYGYFSVRVPGGVHSFSDSQFGHIFARGKDREEARINMVLALSRIDVRGKISNTSEYILGLIESDTFKKNLHTTAWLDSLIAEKEKIRKPNQLLTVSCGAILKLYNFWNSNKNEFTKTVSMGKYPDEKLLKTRFQFELTTDGKKFPLIGYVRGPNKFLIEMNSSFKEAEVKILTDGSLLVFFDDGESHVVFGREEKNGELRLTVDGKVSYFTSEVDPTTIRSSVSGKVVKLLVEDGIRVEAGTPIIELEAMKMVLHMKTQYSGVVKFECVGGDVIDEGDLLAHLELDSGNVIIVSPTFEGTFHTPKAIESEDLKYQVLINDSVDTLKRLLLGYDLPESFFEKRLDTSIQKLRLLKGIGVLIHQFIEELSNVRAVIPSDLKENFETLLSDMNDKYLGEKLYELYKSTKLSNAVLQEEFLAKTQKLLQILEKIKIGSVSFAFEVISPLLKLFIEVERSFDNTLPKNKIYDSLRKRNNDIENIHRIYLSHRSLRRKVNVVKKIMELYFELGLLNFNSILFSGIENFSMKPYKEVVSFSKVLLRMFRLPSFNKSRECLMEIFRKCVLNEQNDGIRNQFIDSVVKDLNIGLEVILSFFKDGSKTIRDLALESYLRRACSDLELDILQVNKKCEGCWITLFKFRDMKGIELNGDLFRGPYSPNIESVNEVSDWPDVFGVLGLFDGLESFLKGNGFSSLVESFGCEMNSCDENNVLNILIQMRDGERNSISQEDFSAKVEAVLLNESELLKKFDVNRVTVVFLHENSAVNYFTFRKRFGFKEDPILRNIEPTFAHYLELRKLKNYEIQTCPLQSNHVHAFGAHAPKDKYTKHLKAYSPRMFIRSAVLHGGKGNHLDVEVAEEYFLLSLDGLSHAMSESECEYYENHIFINFLPVQIGNEENLRDIVRVIQEKHSLRLTELRVSCIELKMKIKLSVDNEDVVSVRVFMNNQMKFKMDVNAYVESVNLTGALFFSSLFGETSPLEGVRVTKPYPLLSLVEVKRSYARHRFQCRYVYDFPSFIERALRRQWKEYVERGFMDESVIPKTVLEAREIIMDPEDNSKYIILPESRPGENKAAMVSWILRLRTPHFPNGREIILVAGDISIKVGSMGILELKLFLQSQKLAMEMGIPRIYLTSNSGARMGLAEELKQHYKVCWIDPTRPDKGFKYLYFSPEDYSRFPKSVNVEVIKDEGEERCKIVDIIGEDGINHLCMAMCAHLMGQTSRAYQKVFTLTYVNGLSIGIAAYVTRLGHRVIQRVGHQIILTGANAINKILGKNVYVAHNQLGGTQIMHPNGITHVCANDDNEGFYQMLTWLSFIAPCMGSPAPYLKPVDPFDRKVESIPSQELENYNPRDWLSGKKQDGKFIPGFFDKGSFFETLTGWATTVLVGRARLGGIPVGVIGVETETKHSTIPADPENEESKEMVEATAGRVFYPKNSYKVAQAINDFNNGEELPLFIFPNWRGFSGRLLDMYNEVLKFGSQIVDALVGYKHPIFMYIPPHAELRGGAWSVLDTNINTDCIEFYVDHRCRSGILEPRGTVEIKYRKHDIEKTIKRLSPNLFDPKDESKMKKLFGAYHNVATKFADLHDTPGRMIAKGVIRKIVKFEDSRKFFYHRLQRRLHEFTIFKSWEKISNGHSKSKVEMKECLKSIIASEKIWNDDILCKKWYDENSVTIREHLVQEKQKVFQGELELALKENPKFVIKSLLKHAKKEGNKEFKREILNNFITMIST